MRITGIILASVLVVVDVTQADEIVTTAGQVYSNVKVSRADPLGVNITHKSGVARVLFSEMTENDRKKYGYDPQKEEAFLLLERQRRTAAEQAARDQEKRREEERARQERQRQQQLAAQEQARTVEVARQEQARRDLFKPSGMSVAAFHAMRPQETTVFLAKAHLSDYFNYDFSEAKDLCWSVDLRTPEGGDIGNGYIRKEGRGQALFALIQDGKWHSIVARVRYPSQSRDSGVFFLDDYQESTEGRTSEGDSE